MAYISQEAGPEWAYIALLTRKKGYRFDFDSLYVNVQRQGDEPATKIDSIQSLSNHQGMYVPSDITRFSFDKLKELIGFDSDDFDLSFEAYEGAEPGVAISDPSSFRRLLLAIGHLGFPTPESATEPTDFPPVLRFLARPKDDSPGASAVVSYRPRPRGSRTYPPVPPEEEEVEPPPVPQHNVGRRIHVQDFSDTPTGHKDTPPPEDTPFGYGNTPQQLEDVGVRPRSPSVESPQQSGVPLEPGRSSFLAPPRQPQRKPLTFEERVQKEVDYGLSSDVNDVHNEDFHNLYADIAGIDRNKRDPGNRDHEYKPPYSNISLPPSQSYPTGWIMSESGKLVYYLGDKMGLGKTFAAIECMIRIMLIVSNGIAIKDERSRLSSLREPPLHIHEQAHPRFGTNQTCRANTLTRYGFICQCDTNSPTHQVTETGNFNAGYMLVVLPLRMVDTWVQQLKRFLRTNVRLPHNQRHIETINVHEGDGNYGVALMNFINGNSEHFGLGTIVIVPATTTISPSLVSLQKKPQRQLKTQPALICWDEMHLFADPTTSIVKWVQALIDQSQYATHVLAMSGTPWRKGPKDFDVIETIALDERSVVGWWTRDVYDEYAHRLKNTREKLNESAKRVTQSEILGRGKRGHVSDGEKKEAHEVLSWHDQRLREYASQIPLLQRKEGSSYLGYQIPKRRPESQPTQLVKCDSVMNDAQKKVANYYREFLRVSHRRAVQAWNRKEKSTRGPRPKIRSHLFSLDSFLGESSRIDVSLVGFAPGVTQQVLERSENSAVQFRSPEANRVFRNTTTQSQKQAVRNSPYWAMAQSAFEKIIPQTGQTVLHPKIVFICSKIDEMLADRSPHKNGQRELVLPKKMIIAAPHPFQSLLLISYLFQRYPNHNFTFVGAANEQNKERPALLAPFQRSTDNKHPDDGRSTDPIALISTHEIIGVGLNLIRCNYLIATSPLASKANEDQLFGRIDRTGQNCAVHGYVLLDQGNPVDVTTFYRMKLRTALTVAPDEIGTGLDFLLEDIDEEDEREPDIADIDETMGEANEDPE